MSNTLLNRLAPLWMFAARLETWKTFCHCIEQVKNIIWKPGKDFVFDFGKGREDHLGSPCLCFLDYQAQIGIPVIGVLSIYTFLIRAQCIAKQ